MRKRNNKKKNYFTLLLLLVVTIGIGYAFLTQELTINGTGKVTASNWSIYFDNLVFNSGNVALSTGDSAATINSTTLTDVTYTITLQKPGDFYEFTVDVVNDGTIDAMIGSVSSKLGGVEIDQEHPLPSYLNYSVTYSDDIAIAPNHLLEAGDTETYKVRLEFRKDISATDLPSTAQTLTFNFSVEYVQADGNAIARPVRCFADDSWETIVANVQNGTIPDYYTVGSTKEVNLGNDLGTHILRIANTSTPDECLTEGFSQTACGFVLEFADIISQYNMNPVGNTQDSHFGTTKGGWPASEMRTYVNSTIYNSLPTVIKNAIINTIVVSGHSRVDGETNFTSTDRIYLLGTHEVFEDDDGDTSSGIDYMDTAYYNTRQLDYYANHEIAANVSHCDGLEAIKQYNDSNSLWWLRSTTSTDDYYFSQVNVNGCWTVFLAKEADGVSPAFRLAGPKPATNDPCDTFRYDSWETVISNAQSNNYSQYRVGCEKSISLGNDLGSHKVRIANNTTPSECGTAGFSKTACGFVLEFVDILTNSVMNSTNTSVGGWPASELRTYLNDTNSSTSIINSLPSTIKDAIIDTTVISGYEYGATDGNYSSTDRLYLLADIEITGTANAEVSLTTSHTRQLDYYRTTGTTSSNRTAAIKNNGQYDFYWWLRNPSYQSVYQNIIPFTMIEVNGTCNLARPNTSFGVSPVFRLAE